MLALFRGLHSNTQTLCHWSSTPAVSHESAGNHNLVVGAYVQFVWIAGAVLKSLGEKFIQSGEMGQETLEIWRLSDQDTVIHWVVAWDLAPPVE